VDGLVSFRRLVLRSALGGGVHDIVFQVGQVFVTWIARVNGLSRLGQAFEAAWDSFCPWLRGWCVARFVCDIVIDLARATGAGARGFPDSGWRRSWLCKRPSWIRAVELMQTVDGDDDTRSVDRGVGATGEHQVDNIDKGVHVEGNVTSSMASENDENGLVHAMVGGEDMKDTEPSTQVSTKEVEVSIGSQRNERILDARQELRSELQKRRPSVLKVRKLCRQGLDGCIPGPFRVDVWQILLGIESKHRFLLDDSIRDTKQDLENQRVIRVDAERTRADLAEFRTPEMQLLVSKLLTFYCKRKNIKYKQGLNEVLAPFLILRTDPPLPDGTIFNMYYAFIEKYLRHIYVHEDFHALQCTFRLFRLLLQYHDPELCNHLDTHNLSPELYATPWFLTLFARSVPINVLFRLWDTYLLEEDEGGAHLHMFVSLALTLENRRGLLDSHPSDLPIYLTGVMGPLQQQQDSELAELAKRNPLKTVEGVSRIIGQARSLMRITPVAFRRAVYNAVLQEKCPTLELLDKLEAKPCLDISARQIIELILNDRRTRDEEMVIVVVDCRPNHEFEQEHLIGSLHLDPVLLELPDKLKLAIKALSERITTNDDSVKIHCAFLGPGVDPGSVNQLGDQNCTLSLLHAIQNGFARVSCVEHGWAGVKLAATEKPVFETGPAMDPLFDQPVSKPRSPSVTFDTFKDAMSMDSIKGVMGIGVRDKSPSPPPEDSSSANWMQRIGKTIGDANIGELFTSSTSPKNKHSRSDTLPVEIDESTTAALKATPVSTDTGNPSSQEQTGSSSFMGRIASKWETLTSSANVKDEDVVSEKKISDLIAQEDEGNPEGMWVDLSDWSTADDITIFQATKYLSKSQNTCETPDCLLVVSSGYVLRLEVHKDRPNFARIQEKYMIANLVKVSYVCQNVTMRKLSHMSVDYVQEEC